MQVRGALQHERQRREGFYVGFPLPLVSSKWRLPRSSGAIFIIIIVSGFFNTDIGFYFEFIFILSCPRLSRGALLKPVFCISTRPVIRI